MDEPGGESDSKPVASQRKEVRMLVLSRKESECIRIGEQIVVTIKAIRGNRVIVGIEAPPDVKVYRDDYPTAPRGYRPGRDDLEVNDV
jgi:carbon storage regulator CsrA